MKFILALIIFAFLIFFPIHCSNPYQPRSFSRAIAVMPNGEYVCDSGRDTIDIWCPYNNKVSASLRGHRSHSVTALVILPNGNLASGSMDCTIKIWNPNLEQNVALMRIIRVPGDEINALALLQNGDLASGTKKAKIKIWNPMNGTLLRTLTGHSLSINALVCLNNGFLASGSRDKTIKIWN
ncbi:serine threonine kinase [Brachionus plicatilis]|uniref:Serine threonine kinase n=1 Tax=Brachionus plicatilis TaxID=10195 RepID=A0A3M7QTV4_BRAPC|nr:serine threonine kinase [Brachionus plicatilis]